MSNFEHRRKKRREKSQRLFVACAVPIEIGQQYERVVDVLGLNQTGEWRVIGAERLHLTLMFIGPVRGREYGEVVESVGRSVSGLGAFEMRPRGVRTLPEKGEVRTLVVEMEEEPTMKEIHRRLVHRLAREARDAERFVPHVTVARMRAGGKGRREMFECALPSVSVKEVVLMESVLRMSGAEYVVRERYELET